MVPPGYGLSDLALVIGIADRLYTKFKDAPEQFQDLSQDVEDLKSTVKNFALGFPTVEQNSNDSTKPGKFIKEAEELLKTLEAQLQKFKGSFVDRLLFERNTKKPRDRLRNLTSSISAYHLEVIRQDTGSMRTQLAQIVDELVKDKLVDESIGSTLRDEFLNEIYARLQESQISVHDINKDLIIDAMVKGVEDLKNTLPSNPSATRSNMLETHGHQDNYQLSNVPLNGHEWDLENIEETFRYPWDTAALLSVELTSIQPVDEEAELKASILRAATKRISLQTLGRSSMAHAGLPPDPPSGLRRDTIALFDKGSFRPAQPSFDKSFRDRTTSTSSLRERDLPILARMPTQSSSASRRASSSIASRRTPSSHSQQAPKAFLFDFFSGIGQSSWSVMEKTEETSEPVSTSPRGFEVGRKSPDPSVLGFHELKI